MIWQETAIKLCKGTATTLGVGLLLGVVHRPPSAPPSSLVHHAQQSTAASSPSLTAHECPQTPEKKEFNM